MTLKKKEQRIKNFKLKLDWKNGEENGLECSYLEEIDKERDRETERERELKGKWKLVMENKVESLNGSGKIEEEVNLSRGKCKDYF